MGFNSGFKGLSLWLCSFLHSPVSYAPLNTPKRRQNAVNHRFRRPILYHIQKRRPISKILQYDVYSTYRYEGTEKLGNSNSWSQNFWGKDRLEDQDIKGK